jgi:hypothetical protein
LCGKPFLQEPRRLDGPVRSSIRTKSGHVYQDRRNRRQRVAVVLELFGQRTWRKARVIKCGAVRADWTRVQMSSELSHEIDEAPPNGGSRQELSLSDIATHQYLFGGGDASRP